MAKFPEIPGCKIERVLGEGAAATVYLGIEKKLNREAAIKVLDPSLMQNKVSASRFEKEAELAANLSHSNIVQIFDTGKSGDYCYIAMEYLEYSLKDFMQRQPGGLIDPIKALDIVENIMKALDYAHLKGIYHRDIKPENIMFRKDGTPVLVDFGIAKILKDKSKRLTFTGQSMGSVNYMSPEQCKAKKNVDGRSDIYSLGAVLFEMLSGKKPYEGKTSISIALKQIEAEVPRLPEGLERCQELIDKMMAKNRKKRLSTGPQFMKLRDRILTRPDSSSSQPGIGLSPQKEVIIIEPPVNRYIYESIDPKVRLFIKVAKKKFDTFKEYLENEFLPLKNVPFQHILTLGILLMVLIIILFIFVF